MGKHGILLHVYNLGSENWERLVWGDPTRDQLGVGAKLFEQLLGEPANREIVTILYDGPSQRAGQQEGAYTKDFLLGKLGSIDDFPRLATRFSALTAAQREVFQRRVEGIIIGERIDNTTEEISFAASRFNLLGVSKVIHIAAASHAPRCIQQQAAARQKGLIPSSQQWFTVASDVSFAGTIPSDVVVVEPPHRADDPLLGFKPALAGTLRSYYTLAPADKKLFSQKVEGLMRSLLARDVRTKIKDINEQ